MVWYCSKVLWNGDAVLPAPVVDIGATPTFPTPLVPASVSLKPMRPSFSSLFLRRPQILQAKIPATARTMAPPTPTTTPMMVFLVWVDMPELLLPLLPSDRLAVGVDTVSEVELLTEPSDWVTMTTVVEVVGVGVAVVEDSVEVMDDVWESSVAVADDVVELGVAAGSLVLVGVGVAAASGVEVVELVVTGSAAEVGVAEVVSADGVVVAATTLVVETVLPLPLESACLWTSSLLNCLTSWLNNEPSMMKAWVAVVADRAATSSLNTLVGCMLRFRQLYKSVLSSPCVGRRSRVRLVTCEEKS